MREVGGEGEDSTEPEDRSKAAGNLTEPGQDKSKGISAQAEGATTRAHKRGYVGSGNRLDSLYNCITYIIKYYSM